MTEPATEPAPPPLAEQLVTSPVAVDEPRIETEFAELVQTASEDPNLSSLNAYLKQPRVAALLRGIFSGSPHLTRLIRCAPQRLQVLLHHDPEVRFKSAMCELETAMAEAGDISAAMRHLRAFKCEVALLCGLADLGGVWPVMKVTDVLSETADIALQTSIAFLFRQAISSGDWLAEDPSANTSGREAAGRSGYIVLGMGKHGARELNYSSDIDLIVFYDPDRARLRDGLDVSSFFVRMTRDLVRLMDERTRDGYVFRTDLRLRPDAGATQVALSVDAALSYYESVGQNWERAALLKARPVAGDLEAGENILQALAPYIWRKYLDFAAIADIHAMKRQVHAFRGLGEISVAGHNVKLGRGGIREIEFFAQTQQLIAGGRQPDLRVRATLDALERLEARGWISTSVRTDLSEAYLYLRHLEHRIQMVADEQTHELPSDKQALASLARFCGIAEFDDFAKKTVRVFETVQTHYAALFEKDPELTSTGKNLVFAGEDDDPDTIANLSEMGFQQPRQIIAGVRAWHRGRYAALRSRRSQELLTDVQPVVIQALSDTADPDRAFAEFDRFMSVLPAGVQLFAVLKANPGLLKLLADILGTAPRLARILSRRHRLLDAVLDPRTFSVLPSADELDRTIKRAFAGAEELQDVLDRARIVGNEQIFLIGVRILTGSINAHEAGGAYALLAERLILALERTVNNELTTVHGEIAGGATSVVAMGKLGGLEMTASSDLDLIIVYDFDDAVAESSSAKPLAPSHYYTRLTQRLITALSAQTAEGRLYEVDMRLRPSGNMGPVATALSSFVDYQSKQAWTWEHMALTRARVVSGPRALRDKVASAIDEILRSRREPKAVAADVQDMRQRILEEKQTDDMWELKQVRGGLVDLEFIAQYLQLVHACDHPEVLDQNTVAALRKLQAADCLSAGDGEALVAAARLLQDLGQILRLCMDGPFDPASAPTGLKDLMARAGDSPSFEALEAKVSDTLKQVLEMYERIVA